MGSFGNYIKRICNQTAVYWEYDGDDGYGSGTYKDPVEIGCRWVRRREVMKNNEGNEVFSDTQVLTTQDIVEESVLYQGKLDDLDSGGVDPKTVTNAHKVMRFEKIPNLKGTEYKRVAYLNA